MSYAIGIDIGGTTIKAGVVDENNAIIKSMALPTLSQEGGDDGEKVAACMEKLVRTLCGELGVAVEDIGAVGACVPGSIDGANGVVVYTNNIDLHNVPLREMMQGRIGKQIAMGNDADVAAYGEYVAGSLKGCRRAIMITLGTGVGSGIVLDGKIYEGFAGRGGELGHTVVQMGGVKCTCGRAGCLESYASATGLIRMTRECMQKDSATGMWELVGGDIERVDGKTAFDAMEKGDAAAQRVVDTYIKYLGCGIANFINIFHPEKIAFGGGISKSGEALLVPLRVETYKNVYGGADEKTTKLVEAQLGNSAGIIGAAMLGGQGF